MTKVGGYGIYQNNYYENTIRNQKEKEKVKESNNSKTEETGKNSQVKLSNQAKALLQELKKKYGNMDFIVADYESEEEAAAYLSHGTKEYSVLIEPESLEEMAADEKTKEKYLSLIDEATATLADAKEELGEEGDEVTRLGVSIAKDGTVSYFAELEKTTAKQKERLEKVREEKKAEKQDEEKKAEKQGEEKEANKLYEKKKRTRVKAASIDELIEKIEQVDWSKIEAEEEKSGSRINYSV